VALAALLARGALNPFTVFATVRVMTGRARCFHFRPLAAVSISIAGQRNAPSWKHGSTDQRGSVSFGARPGKPATERRIRLPGYLS
jgi:hypothetical protein